MLTDLTDIHKILTAVASKAMNIDGNKSTDEVIFCPLFKGEQAREDEDRMLIENFNLW